MTRLMKCSLVGGLISLALCFAVIPIAPGKCHADSLNDSDLASLVKRAYVYTFPVHDMYRTRYDAVYRTGNTKHADINQFFHERKLADHTFRDFTTPNNDAPYSSAWLDLSREPVIISVPDTAGRYYVLALMDFYTNNFSYIGHRVTGTRKGDYLVAGPGWKGITPGGLILIKSPTDAVWILGRTLVADEADLANVYKIQDQYKLTPLSVWKGGADRAMTVYGGRSSAPPAPDPKDPWNYWTIVTLGMTENPPPAGDAPLLAEFARIGIGPGLVFNPDRFSPIQKEIVLQAMAAAAKAFPMDGRRGVKRLYGWSYNPPYIGNFGNHYDYRALISLVGLGALEPAEATYSTALVDRDGQPFTGAARYRLRFSKQDIPPVNAFWSLTMYEVMKDGRGFFTANPINRYSIGDRTKGLKYNADGSLDIYIQHQSPGKDLESNWLPAPPGVFRLTMRMYEPREPVLNGTYTLPGVQRLAPQ